MARLMPSPCRTIDAAQLRCNASNIVSNCNTVTNKPELNQFGQTRVPRSRHTLLKLAAAKHDRAIIRSSIVRLCAAITVALEHRRIRGAS